MPELMEKTMGMDSVTVIKKNLAGEETWRYEGVTIERGQNHIVLEARFNRQDMPFEGILLKHNDRWVETYYTDRWYNIFEIHDRDDDHLKGWYCNISLPAEINQRVISYIDLALDLLVYPDGSQKVLDEDEFDALALPAEMHLQAQDALRELQTRFDQHQGEKRSS